MKTRRFIYDPRKMILLVFDGEKNLGGYIGQIAERKFEGLLMTDEQIAIGEFLTKREIEDRNKSKSYEG